MGSDAARICVRRRTKKICGGGGIAERGKRRSRVSDELFGVTRKFISSRHDRERKRFADHRDRGIDGRASGRRKRVSQARFWIRGNAARIGGLLPELSWPIGERGAARRTTAEGL